MRVPKPVSITKMAKDIYEKNRGKADLIIVSKETFDAITRCKKHPRYKGVYPPRVKCRHCKSIYEASPIKKQSLKDQAKDRRMWMNRAIKTFNAYIRLRDGNRCMVCGTLENPTAGHCFSAVAESTRFDEENVFCQCKTCNFNHERDFEPFRRKVEQRLGREKYDELVMRYWSTRKHTTDELMEIVETYEEKLKELGREAEAQPANRVRGQRAPDDGKDSGVRRRGKALRRGGSRQGSEEEGTAGANQGG